MFSRNFQEKHLFKDFKLSRYHHRNEHDIAFVQSLKISDIFCTKYKAQVKCYDSDCKGNASVVIFSAIVLSSCNKTVEQEWD